MRKLIPTQSAITVPLGALLILIVRVAAASVRFHRAKNRYVAQIPVLLVGLLFGQLEVPGAVNTAKTETKDENDEHLEDEAIAPADQNQCRDPQSIGIDISILVPALLATF